jgi:DNA-binding response OmpR family regulator
MAPQESTPDKTSGRVLVVEDDPHIRELVLLHLKLEGLDAVASGDGTDGLRIARSEPFDLMRDSP